MTYRMTTVALPATEPLTLADVKDFLRVTHDDDDDALTRMIAAARGYAERHTGRSLIRRTLCLYDRRGRPDDIRLPHGPVLSVDSVARFSDSTSVETAIASQNYIFSAAFNCVRLKFRPLADEIRVTYAAGYGDSGDDVPEPLLEGMRLHIAQLYANPQTDDAIPDGAKHRYNSYRMPRIV